MSKRIVGDDLILSVMRAVAAFQDAADQVDEAAARQLGLNRTDLRCLGILTRVGPMTTGQLATAAGLSPGATTTAVDRLARAGYAERSREGQDRRRVTVRATPNAHARSDQIWGPIGQESYLWLSERDETELRVIHDFLREGERLQVEHAARVASQQLYVTDGRG